VGVGVGRAVLAKHEATNRQAAYGVMGCCFKRGSTEFLGLAVIGAFLLSTEEYTIRKIPQLVVALFVFCYCEDIDKGPCIDESPSRSHNHNVMSFWSFI
jgi:hypothetical protein